MTNWLGRLRLPRFVLMIGGEAMQSGLHFVLNLVLIGLLPQREYGLFAFTMVIGGVGLTYVRGLTAMPASIYVGGSRSPRVAVYYQFLFAPIAAILSTLIALLTAGLLLTWSREAACAGAVFVGLWCFRSHVRGVQYALERSRSVTFSDLAFAVSGSMFAGLAVLTRQDLLVDMLLALAGANAIALAALYVIVREPLRLGAPLRAIRFYAGIAPRLSWSALSVTTANLQGQGVSLLVGVLAGPAAFAPLAAMLAIFAPLRILGTALANMMQPEVARLVNQSDWKRIAAINRFWSIRVAFISLGYGALAMALLRLVHLRALQGEPILLIGVSAWLVYSLSLLSVAPRVLLEVRMRFRSVALIMAGSAVVGMSAIFITLEAGAPAWALGGSAIGEFLVVVAAGRLARKELFIRSVAPSAYSRPTLSSVSAGPLPRSL